MNTHKLHMFSNWARTKWPNKKYSALDCNVEASRLLKTGLQCDVANVRILSGNLGMRFVLVDDSYDLNPRAAFIWMNRYCFWVEDLRESLGLSVL